MSSYLFIRLIFFLSLLISSYLFNYIFIKTGFIRITKNKLLFKVLIMLIFMLLFYIGIIILDNFQLPYDNRERIKEIISGFSIGGGVIANLVYHRNFKDSI